MAALDTNVLVRFLVADDAAQHASAKRLVAQALQAGEALFVPITVALELEWVLRSNFSFGKEAVLATYSALLATFELAFESEAALEVALAAYRQGKADFADSLHAALAQTAGHAPLWTFDRMAAKVPGARLLGR